MFGKWHQEMFFKCGGWAAFFQEYNLYGITSLSFPTPGERIIKIKPINGDIEQVTYSCI